MSDQIWKITYEDNEYGKKTEKTKEFEEPVLIETVLDWRKDYGHVIKKVESTGDRVTWKNLTKMSSWI